MSRDGIVLSPETRTNAGVDHFLAFGEPHQFTTEGERVMVLMTSGNPGITWTVVAMQPTTFPQSPPRGKLPSIHSRTRDMAAIIHQLSSTEAEQEEWRLRLDMAAVFRVAARLGWNEQSATIIP